jgi:hypothetical protein
MRLRTTAPPNAFFMLKPKRLCGSWFVRKKTVKWELERRFPVRYTASNSPLRTNRAARGKSRLPGSLGCEAMTSLLATRRKHLAAALRLHAHAKSVRLRAPPLPRLISSLWHSNPPRLPVHVLLCLRLFMSTFIAPAQFHPAPRKHTPPAPADSPRPAASAALFESVSVVDPHAHGQERGGVAYKAGKSDTPLCSASESPSTLTRALLLNPPFPI